MNDFPQPDFETPDGRVRLYLGDCLNVLPKLPSGCVDAVVTDPPYGIGFSRYESDDDTPDGYGDWIWSAISQAESKCSPGSPIFCWQAQENICRLHEFFPRKWRLFIAARNFTQMNRDKMPRAFEPVVVWWTEGERFLSPRGEGVGVPRDWFIADVAGGILRNKKSGASCHPCPRQVDVMAFIVGNWCRPDSFILDPFMGSGTTGVACIQTGRRFIGVEKEPRYFEIAVNRIKAALKAEREKFQFA